MYGITLEVRDQMIEEQGGCCSICGSPFSEEDKALTPCIDHCHLTNQVRSILCRRCNIGLGSFLDDPELLEKAAAYLKKFAKTLDTHPENVS